MTPFMLAVQALLHGDHAREPKTEPSRRRPVAVATDAYAVMRALAEQMVSEANAVLREHGEGISLVDASGPGELAFTLRHGDRTAKVRTVVSGHTAVAQLVMTDPPVDEPRELTSQNELQALVLSLLGD
jgi:hypothetical protein